MIPTILLPLTELAPEVRMGWLHLRQPHPAGECISDSRTLPSRQFFSPRSVFGVGGTTTQSNTVADVSASRVWHVQYPYDLLSYLSARGLHMGCNLHDDDGVLATDKMHDALAAYLGLPSTVGDIPFSAVNKSYIYGLQDIVLGDVVKQGMWNRRAPAPCRMW